LIKLGFDKYHARAVALGAKQLFDIKPDARGYYSGEPSKFFGNYLRDIGVKSGRNLNFHSFRHTAADAFRRADLLCIVIGEIRWNRHLLAAASHHEHVAGDSSSAGRSSMPNTGSGQARSGTVVGGDCKRSST
jgi:hypothetical protein